MKKQYQFPFSVLLPIFLVSTAHAHVTIAEGSAVQGAYHRAAFKIGHGCEGSPTVKVVVDLPEGLEGAKPMPKPGWRLSTETRPLSTPTESHGRRITERVARVVWEGGPLPDTHYDEFVMQFQVNAGPGPLWIAVDQVCEKGSNPWKEVPAAGQNAHGLKFPAARLDVLAPPSQHKHH